MTQTVLITGANRGLGLEFARQYAADGWTVIACCRTPAKADELLALTKKQLNVSIEALNVSDMDSVKALAAKLKEKAIDLLINNAGIYSGASPEGVGSNDNSQSFGTIDGDAWMKVLHTNTIAPIVIAQAFTPIVARSKEAKIVNITSKMGSLGEMGNDHVAYRSSKSALNAAMLAIKDDLKQQKIAIANLHPGWVQTDMGGNNALINVEQSVMGMRKVIANLSLKNSGQFVAYDGKVIPW